MQGLYIHIPFCKKACHYCDFHFSTSQHYRTAMWESMGKEIRLQQSFLSGTQFDTLYFGGGTPSLLTEKELDFLLEKIYTHFQFPSSAEFTLEANPDDLTKEKLVALKKAGVNRLSIGVQSFDDNRLKNLNRIHSAAEAERSVRLAQDIGFNRINVDLLFSMPGQTLPQVMNDLQRCIHLETSHISIYSLTIEKDTAFGRWTMQGKIHELPDEDSAQQFENIMDTMEQNRYEQYEISNFAKDGHYSLHNSNYWNQSHYLGIGPGAHSYNGERRQLNRPHNADYIKALEKNIVPCEKEILTLENKMNEYLFTRLRTQQGCDTSYLRQHFACDIRRQVEPLIEKGWICQEGEIIFLTKKGKLLADSVVSHLFV